MRLSLIRKVCSIALIGVASFTSLSDGFSGRIAVTADGNYHDRDDIGATALTLGIIARAGQRSKLVHYDFNSHIWDNYQPSEYDMKVSVYGTVSDFGYNKAFFFNDLTNPTGAVNNLAKQINASTSTNRLWILLAGPTEILWRAVNKSNQAKRKYVTVISHSLNNEMHASLHNAHDAAAVKALGVKWLNIADQNGVKSDPDDGFCTSTMSTWTWLKKYGTSGTFIYRRIDEVDNFTKIPGVSVQGITGDASDAGMAYYLFTGDQDGNWYKLSQWWANQG